MRVSWGRLRRVIWGPGCMALDMPWKRLGGALVVAWGGIGLLWIEVTWDWCECAFGVSLGALEMSCGRLGAFIWGPWG